MKTNIIIRKAKKGDAKKIATLIKEGLKANNFLYIGKNKPLNKEKIKKIDNAFGKKGSFYFVAIDKTKDKLVGSINCSYKTEGRLRHRGDCGWSINPDYQKMGIGTMLLKEIIKEAKKEKLKRLEAEMAIKNKGSWKLAQKCGFKIEGTKKKALITDDNKLIDTYIVGKLL